MRVRMFGGWLLAGALCFGPPAVQAQWAVVDVGAIAQLLKQVQTLEQQLQTAQNALSQARQTYQAATGSRGMQNLLAGTVRNYLPADWAQLEAALNGNVNAYGTLAASIRSAVAANTVMSPAALAALSPTERALVETQRRNTALLQGLSQQALTMTSGHFALVQQLINAIGGASDPKAIMDLQARIAAEQGMLQTDQSKLQVLYQSAQAEEVARRGRSREQAIVDGGSLRQLPPMGL